MVSINFSDFFHDMLIVQAFRPVSLMVTNGCRVFQLLHWRIWTKGGAEQMAREGRVSGQWFKVAKGLIMNE